MRQIACDALLFAVGLLAAAAAMPLPSFAGPAATTSNASLDDGVCKEGGL